MSLAVFMMKPNLKSGASYENRLSVGYQTILRNQCQPVHLVIKLTAEGIAHQRQNQLAFCIVLDRSGSMAGKPLEHARKASELVVKTWERTITLAW